ncbi:MAG: MerR family transcriptional regulator [Candidatus Thorarchaeota archaeon]
MRDKFSTLDIVKAFHIPRERLRDWMNNGFIVPTTKSEGQGTKAIFTRDDIYMVALFVDFLKKGFKRDNASDYISKVSKALKKNGSKNLAYIIIYLMNNRNNTIFAEPIYNPVTRWDKIDLRWGGRIPSKFNKRSTKSAPGLNEFLSEDDARPSLSTTQRWENLYLINFIDLKTKVDLELSIFD